MRYAILILALALGGCSITGPNGEKMSREAFRAQHAQQMMTLAVAADREYDSRNPIQPPPEVCRNPDQTTMDGMDLAFCAMAMATYNAQLQIRDQNRKAQAEYTAHVLDTQAEERYRKASLWLNNPITGALAQRYIAGSGNTGGNSPRISIKGHTIKGSGAGGSGEAGGAGSGHSAGDQNVTVVVGDNNQSGSGAGTYSPVLEYATQMGSTRPVWSEGAQDNRSMSDDASLLNGGIF